MQKRDFRALFVMLLLLFSTFVIADNFHTKMPLPANQQLMTPRDVKARSFSNITIQNKTGSPTTIYGLYIHQFAYTTPNTPCAAPTLLYPGAGDPADQAGGAFVTQVAIPTNQKLPIGQNYLYNMLYTAIYYDQVQPSCDPGGLCSPCKLPGCTLFPNVAPFAPVDWCIYVGVLQPASGNTTTSASVPPYGFPVTDAGYNYNAVTHYEYIGPISCNDQKLTCSVSTAQNVPFPQ